MCEDFSHDVNHYVNMQEILREQQEEENYYGNESHVFGQPPPISRQLKPKPIQPSLPTRRTSNEQKVPSRRTSNEQKVPSRRTSNDQSPFHNGDSLKKPKEQKLFKKYTPTKGRPDIVIENKPPETSVTSLKNSFEKPKPPILSQKPKPKIPTLPKPTANVPMNTEPEDSEIYFEPDSDQNEADGECFYTMPEGDADPSNHVNQNFTRSLPPPPQRTTDPPMSGNRFMEHLSTLTQKKKRFENRPTTLPINRASQKQIASNKNVPKLDTRNTESQTNRFPKRAPLPVPNKPDTSNRQASPVHGRPICPLPHETEIQRKLSARKSPIGQRKAEPMVEEYTYVPPEPISQFGPAPPINQDNTVAIYEPDDFVSISSHVRNDQRKHSVQYIAPDTSHLQEVPPKAPERISEPRPLLPPPVATTKKPVVTPKTLIENRLQKPAIPANNNRAHELPPQRPHKDIGRRMSPIGQENDRKPPQVQQPPHQLHHPQPPHPRPPQQQQVFPPKDLSPPPRPQIPVVCSPLPAMFENNNKKLGPNSVKEKPPFGSNRSSFEQNMSSPHPLQNFPWFNSQYSRGEATSKLNQSKKEGEFIIRTTDKCEGYSISIYHQQAVTHLQVPLKDGSYSLGTSDKKFTSVPELVRFYQRNTVLLTSGGEVMLRKV